MKYRVLLVDDEKLFLMFLRSVICWEDYNCEICGMARSGEDALRMIRENCPDIVLMDISMSGMNGLQVCEAIQKEALPCHVVIITAHGDFSFCRQAIRANVVDYLLKPFDKDELVRALGHCIECVQEQRTILQRTYEQKLLQLLQGGGSPEAFPEEMKQGAVVAVLFRIRPNAAFPEELFRKLMEQYLPDVRSFFLGRAENLVRVVHLFPSCDAAAREALSQKYSLLLEDPAAIQLQTVSIGRAFDHLGGLGSAFATAEMVQENNGKFQERVVSYETVQETVREDTAYTVLDMEKLLRHLERKEFDQADALIRRIFGLLDGQMFSMQYTLSLYYSFATHIRTCFQNYEQNTAQQTVWELKAFERDLGDCLTTDQTFETIQNAIYELFSDCISVDTDNRKDVLIKAIDDYLQEHYAENTLTIDQIANSLFFENSYIRRVYKMTTGRTILQRLEEIRFGQAKKLLRTENLKNSEVAKLCGFTDQYYFSRRFKQFCGYSPSEYKRRKS